jgi:hypothetical protein
LPRGDRETGGQEHPIQDTRIRGSAVRAHTDYGHHSRIFMRSDVAVIHKITRDDEGNLDRCGVGRAGAAAPIHNRCAIAIGMPQRQAIHHDRSAVQLPWHAGLTELRSAQDRKVCLVDMKVVVRTGKIDQFPSLGRR